MKTVRFDRKKDKEFFQTLKSRVEGYFEENKISKKANSAMVVKTAALTIFYLIPIVLLWSGIITGAWSVIGLYLMLGVGQAGIGLSIMHDANHGAYSEKPKVNNLVSRYIDAVGGSSITWKIQHNVLHHSYTNIDGFDEDIDTPPFLRFSPHSEKRPIHKVQHIYAWFFYSLMTVFWITAKDYIQLARYEKMGLVKGQNTTYKKELITMTVFKVVYWVVLFVIPLIILTPAVSWWVVLLGFILGHMLSGLILAMIFQPAHVMEDLKFDLPGEDGKMDVHPAVHQLETTANFANDSTFLSWYCGGLNFQIEHHLFPNICHVHYKKIAPIVKKTAKEYGIPYHEHKTFVRALWYHTKMLKALGRA
ncbi:MAG: fatty acid desaturase [Flavobacteriales bacterium]